MDQYKKLNEDYNDAEKAYQQSMSYVVGGVKYGAVAALVASGASIAGVDAMIPVMGWVVSVASIGYAGIHLHAAQDHQADKKRIRGKLDALFQNKQDDVKTDPASGFKKTGLSL